MSGFLLFVLFCCGDYTAYMLPPATETYHVYWLRDQQNPAAISALLLTTQPLGTLPAKLDDVQAMQGQPTAQVQQAAAQASIETQALARMGVPATPHRFGRAPRAVYSYIVTTQGQEAIITPAQGTTLALVDLGRVDADKRTVAQGEATYTFEAGTLEQALKLFGDAANAKISPWNGSQEKRMANEILRGLAEQRQQQIFEHQSQTAALKNGG